VNEINNPIFWENLQFLVKSSELVVDRPKDSRHPRFPDMVYPFDYGYIADTSGGDGNEIDVWKGSGTGNKITAIVCTVDLLKKDTEIKIILDCSKKEQEQILQFHNQNKYMKAILINNPNDK